MSWLEEKQCPCCGANDFDPDCEMVDIGVGVQEFDLKGVCKDCGQVAQCPDCGVWLNEATDHMECPGPDAYFKLGGK